MKTQEVQNKITRYEPAAADGLSDQQVEERKQQGLVNAAQSKITKSNFNIFKDNVLTLFNLFNAVLGACLLAVGAYANMLFIISICVPLYGLSTIQALPAAYHYIAF